MALLALCLLNIAALYYVIYVRKEHNTGGWGKAGLITTLFLLVPVIIVSLWHQQQAEVRLTEIGLQAFPGFKSSSGIATGLGESPFWVFTVEGEPGDALAFYEKPENRGGWRIVSATSANLILERETEVLSIFTNEDTIVFSVTRKD